MSMVRMGVKLVCALAVLLSLTACSAKVKFEPDSSALYVDKDGSVVSAEIESFDNSGFTEERYSEDGLQSFVEEAVSSYNREVCGVDASYASDTDETLPVSIESLEVESKKAALYLDYATCEDYMDFIGSGEAVTGLSVQTTAEAAEGGLSLDGLVDGDGEAVDTGKMRESSRYYLVTVSGKTDLMVNGRIAAVSPEGVTVTGKHTVKVSSEKAVYIIFR